MMEDHRRDGVVVGLTSRWHVIQEIDVARLVADHRRLAELCDLLEDCADRLPALPPTPVVEGICATLEALTGAEGQGAPPYFAHERLYDRDDPLALALMEQVSAHHEADAIHAQDLIDALRGGADVAHQLSPNAVGYMLRSFFTGCRRAMDCEELAILALARNRLTAAARSVLLDSLWFRMERRPRLSV